MRRLILGAFQSLDGVVQAPGGPDEDRDGGFRFGGWVVPFFDAEGGAFMGELFGGDFELLLARRTFDIFAAHWPHSTEEPLTGTFNRIAKHVVTHRSDVSAWANSHALPGLDAVAALRESDGPDLIVQGSHTLHGPLLAAGLVDRLVLLTFPIVLGQGKRLLEGGTGSARFALTAQRVSPSGVAMAIYDAAGAVETGSFALDSERSGG